MPVRIETADAIKIRLGIQPNGDLQRKAVSVCRRHMEKYVPKRTGRLRREATETPNSIIYDSIGDNDYHYAGRQYSTQFNHYTTPGTGPYWDKRMWSAEGQDVIRELQNYIGGK